MQGVMPSPRGCELRAIARLHVSAISTHADDLGDRYLTVGSYETRNNIYVNVIGNNYVHIHYSQNYDIGN